MKRKQLLMTLLLALVVPLAAFAQVERTVTVYNGKDTECHVPLYGNVTRMDDLSISQFIMDKSVLQAAGLAGKEITKMTLHLANSVPADYEWTTKRRTIVMLAEVDASELSNDNFIPTSDMTNSTVVFADYLDAHGETMEISFGTPFNYSGEKNLLVQFREEYMYYFNYHPFASYRLPMYYGVYKTGASYWRQLRASNNYSTVSSLNCHFVPKTTFTYLAEANWANTNAPKNASTQSDYSTGNNNSISYYIRMDWDAADNYTGNYQVLCVPRGTSSLDWSTAATTSETFYSFGGLEKNTAYDLYVRAKSLFFTSNVATASATTPFYPANLDEGPLTFDFNSQTMPNGLDFNCSIPRYLSAYGRLGYSNLGTNYVGATVYNDTPPVTITLPELKFTNANNGLMLEFDLQGVGWEVHNFHTAELQVKIYDYGYDEEVFSDTVSASYPSQHFTFRLPDLTTSNYHIYKLSFIYAGGPGFNLDNIVVRKAPNIIPPYNLAASEITPTSAEISWTDDNTNSHTFDLVYRPKGYNNNPDSWEHYVEGVTSPYTLTGLTPYTDYEVKVKTITSSAYEDSEILEFYTLCTPAVVPYNEPFTGLTTLPTDWRVNVPEYAEVVTEVDNDRLTMHNTVTEVTEYYYDYPFTHTLYSDFSAYVILPYFNNLGSLQLSFKAGRTQGALESLQVGVVADPKNYVSFTQIGTATLTDNANGEVYSFNLVNNAVQNGHIVIRLYNSDDVVQSIWLDNFSVQQYAAPTDLEVSNVTNTSATLSWNADAATEWEVRYGTDANSYGSPISVPEPTYTITDLTACTDYVAQVRAKYGENLYSDWVSFDSFKTYYSTPVVVDQTHPYSFGFQYLSMVGTVLASEGGWQMINMGLHANNWMIGTKPGTIDGLNGTNYSLFISKNGTDYQYIHGEQNVIGTWTSWATTVYAARVFNLAPGSYQFSYDWRAKGIHDSDYFRVVLVPANTELTAGTSVPSGFSYNSLPEGWIALDGGEALNPISFDRGFDTYTTPESARINILEGGDYMMVFVWNNMGSRVTSVQNPPIAFDNVAINCTSLVYPPEVSYEASQATDTEAPMYLIAPSQGIAPTSYEVQYEPALAYNNYVGAPIASFAATSNPVSATLTGLTPHTIYNVRIRSVYTANGHSVYSDWADYTSMFTTKYPRPTHLVVVGQTSSWANVRWNPVDVEMTLPDGQYINYWVQLTTDLNDWGEEDRGWSSDSWEKNLAPGTYHFRVQTAVYQEEGNLYMGGSDWSDPITFTIAPWTEPVTIFPLTYDFEEWSNHFADGLTLDGDYENLDILTYGVSDVPAPEEGDNEYALQFRSTANKTACLVLPPLRPSTSSALVSFWWYHNSSDNNAGEGVIVEHSSDGSSWTSFGDVIPRYAAQTGWVKYQKVVPALGTNASYIRLRFIGSNSGQWARYCYLDDLKVYSFKSEKPYISYVGCDGNSATITLYDYAVENGYHSSQFEVQYREWRDPSETPETWADYDVFVNQAPYTFENTLTVNGLQPATCYEFRARARVSYGGYDFDWSDYCEPVRQWTDCGVFAVRPGQSYKEDFEYSNRFDCWSGDKASTKWHICDEGHSSDHCLYLDATGSSYQYSRTVKSPEITFSGCDNVILRFWTKCSFGNPSDINNNYVWVYYKSGSTSVNYQIYTIPETNEWQQVELSLSQNALGSSVSEFKIGFNHNYGRNAWYIDDIEIIANAYDKIFDRGRIGYSGDWNNNSTTYWFPHQLPQSGESVMIMGNARILAADVNVGSIQFGSYGKIELAYNQALSTNGGVGELNASSVNLQPQWQTNAYIDIQPGAELNVSTLNTGKAKSLRVSGIANITTLNAGVANSIVVKNGGVLYAGTITGTSDEVDNTVVVEDGGQLRLDNPAYVTLKKNIGSYTEIEAENNVTKGGYYLISSPLNTNYFNPAMAGACTQVTEGGETVWTYDLYAFDYEQELEWRNYKVQNFLMRNGRGYLYANRDGVDLSFAGPVAANNTQMPVNTNYGEGSLYPFNGWTLVGNPYPCNTYISGSMEGIFVYTQMAGQAVYFNRDEPTEPGSKLGINLMQGNVLVDNAIIRFAEGGELPKFSFSDNTSKVYIPMADDDYAVVSSQPVGVLPLNFEAAKDGTYTLSFEDGTEGLLYCHLIDNKTGADVDLLAGASTLRQAQGSATYTFSAKVDDYAYRFKVVFVAKDEDGSSTGSETFAFNNNGNWIIANEGRATLQVIDLNGRILSSEQIEGLVQTSIHQPAGLYLIRLLNGNDVKIQKVVVR